MVDVLVVPKRLKDRIRKSKHHDVLRRLLPEVMIDSVGVLLIEHSLHLFIELVGSLPIFSKRLLNDHPSPATILSFRKTELLKLTKNALEFRRAHAEVEQTVTARAVLRVKSIQFLSQLAISIFVAKLAAVIVNPICECVPNLLIFSRTRKFADRLSQFFAKAFVGFLTPGEASDLGGSWQIPVCFDVVERRNQLSVGQVPRGTKNDYIARLRKRATRESLVQGVGL